MKKGRLPRTVKCAVDRDTPSKRAPRNTRKGRQSLVRMLRRLVEEAGDAQLLFEMVRAHLLAGNELPTVWVADRQTRDDREVTRARIDVGKKLTGVKCQIQSLLNRKGLSRPAAVPKPCSKGFLAWIEGLVGSPELETYASVALTSLLPQLKALEAEKAYLEEHVAALAATERYAAQADAVHKTRDNSEKKKMILCALPM